MKSVFKLVIFLLTGWLSSCVKDTSYIGSEKNLIRNKLTGDTSLLVGNWNWIYSEHDYNWCNPPASFEVLTPVTENVTFTVQFVPSGVVYFYKDEKLIAEQNIVFREYLENSSGCNSSLATKLFIFLDGNENETFSACMYGDTMQAGFDGFIFSSQEGCESYVNYFVKD